MKGQHLVAFGDVAEITTPAKRTPPNRFLLLKYGRNNFTIDGKQGYFDLTANNAPKLVKEFNDRKRDLVIDYDHSTISPEASSTGNAPASGWIKEMRLTDSGIEVGNVTWTDKAKGLLERGEYRHFSPVLQFDKKSGTPFAIQSVALTNHPAIHGSEPLVAANDINKTNRSTDTMSKERIAELQGFLSEASSTTAELKTAVVAALKELGTITDAKAFSDFKSTIKFDDVSMMDEEAAGEGDGLEVESVDGISALVSWIEDRIAGFDVEKDSDKIANFNTALDTINEYRELAEKPGSEKIPAPDAEAPAVPDAEDMPLSDMSVKAMSDFHKVGTKFLKTHNVKAFDDLSMRMIEQNAKWRARESELLDTIALKDAMFAVDKAIAEGSLTKQYYDWGVDMAKRDMKAFNDFVAKIPPALKAPGAAGKVASGAASKPAKPRGKKVHTDAEIEVAKAFGRSPDDVYTGKFSDESATEDVVVGAPEKKEEDQTGNFNGSFNQ